MLKIQKLSLAALMVSAVVSGSVFAEDKAAPSASDASYACLLYTSHSLPQLFICSLVDL